jgi:hypothetical protein
VWGLAALLVASAVLLPSCGARGGETTKEKLVDAYLKAIERRDANAVEDLLPPGADADKAIQRLLRRHGGRRFDGASVRYVSFDGVYEPDANCSDSPPGSGGLGGAVVRGHGFVHRLDLVVRDGRCYLVLPSDEGPKLREDMPTTTVEGWRPVVTG